MTARCKRPVRYNIAVDEALGQGEHPPVVTDLPQGVAPIRLSDPVAADAAAGDSLTRHVANRNHEDELIGCTTPDG